MTNQEEKLESFRCPLCKGLGKVYEEQKIKEALPLAEKNVEKRKEVVIKKVEEQLDDFEKNVKGWANIFQKGFDEAKNKYEKQISDLKTMLNGNCRVCQDYYEQECNDYTKLEMENQKLKKQISDLEEEKDNILKEIKEMIKYAKKRLSNSENKHKNYWQGRISGLEYIKQFKTPKRRTDAGCQTEIIKGEEQRSTE